MQETEISLLEAGRANSLSVSSITHPIERSLLGDGLIFIGTLMFTMVSIWVKFLEEDKIPLLQVGFVRYVILSLLLGTSILYKRMNGESMAFFGPKKHRTALIIRCFCYFLHVNSFYWALLYIPIGLATLVIYTFPLFTAILLHWGCCSEAEKLSKFAWVCTICGFVGTSLVLSSEGGGHNLFVGVILSLMSSFSWVFQLILIRRTRMDVHWFQIEFLTACVWSYILTPCVWLMQYILSTYENVDVGEIIKVRIEPLKWVQLIAIGFIAYIFLGCLTLGFQMEEAPRGAIIMYIEIPVSYLAQWVLFHHGVSLMELCGVGLVLVGTVGTALEKLSKQEH